MKLKVITVALLMAVFFIGMQAGCKNPQNNNITSLQPTDTTMPSPSPTFSQTPAPTLTVTPQPVSEQYRQIFLGILQKNQDSINQAETDGTYEVSPASIEKTVVINDINDDGSLELIFISGTGDAFHPYALNIYNDSGQVVSLARNVWGIDNYSLFTTANNTLCILELQSDTSGAFIISCYEYAMSANQLVQIDQVSHKVSFPDSSELFTQDGKTISREEYSQITASYITSLKCLLIDQGLKRSGIWWQNETVKYIDSFNDFSDAMWLQIYDTPSIALPFQKAVDIISK